MSNVSDHRTFGELDIAFSRDLRLAWTTSGGHCERKGAFFNAAPGEGGFFPLGTYGMGEQTDPGKPDSSRIAAMMVRPSAQADPNRPPLAPPVGFTEIWNDKGSRSAMDGSCWIPVAPKGYTALGAYFASGHGASPAANDRTVMVCVRNDLVSEVPVRENSFWDDRGSRHRDGDVSTWFPNAHIEPDESKMSATAGTFIANTSHDKPSGPAYALYLPVRSAHPPVKPQVPAMDSLTDKPANPAPQVDHEVEVPFTGIKDPGKSIRWKLENSPFYVLKREVGYTCLKFLTNETEKDNGGTWEITSGVTDEKASEFSSKVGVTVSAETGVSIFGSEAEVSASVTTEFGWSKSSVHTAMSSETHALMYCIPAQHACALWKLNYSFLVVRADESNVPGRLAFVPTGMSAAMAQFPPPAKSGVQVSVEEEAGEAVPLAQSAA